MKYQGMLQFCGRMSNHDSVYGPECDSIEEAQADAEILFSEFDPAMDRKELSKWCIQTYVATDPETEDQE